MTYRVEIDFAPAYEFVLSLDAFSRKQNHKVLELGTAWLKTVQSMITPAFSEKLAHVSQLDDLDLVLFIRKCPSDRTPEGFLRWLERLSAGDMQEIMAEWMETVPADLPAMRDLAVWLLSEWHSLYFRTIDPAILTGLALDADCKREWLDQLAPVDLVEKATNGIRQNPVEKLEHVVLIPQYHARPINLSSHYEKGSITCYPADALPPLEGAPSPVLLRLTRALSDETRLKILRFLAKHPKTFAEITEAIGLAKSTVHYHVIILRAAGLIRVNTLGSAIVYSLRREALQELPCVLDEYLIPE